MITYLDRAPSPTGNGSIDVTINSRDAFVQGVAQIFAPFEKYSFEILAWTGATTHIAVRWTMHATLGKGGAMGRYVFADIIGL